MIILVVGNLKSGKTTLARKLWEDLKIPLMQIDEFRKIFSDGSRLGEERSWKMFLDQMARLDAGIFEMTGTGQYMDKVKDILKTKQTKKLLYKVCTDNAICSARLEAEPYQDIPFPYKINHKTSVSVIAEHLRYLTLPVDEVFCVNGGREDGQCQATSGDPKDCGQQHQHGNSAPL